jgi:hypothetical protein
MNSLKDRKGQIGLWFLSSAAIACGLVYPSILSGPSSASAVATSSYSAAAARTVSNTALKGDRLQSARTGAARKESNDSKNGRKIPAGCEAAFSKLVTNGNFSARCVT